MSITRFQILASWPSKFTTSAQALAGIQEAMLGPEQRLTSLKRDSPPLVWSHPAVQYQQNTEQPKLLKLVLPNWLWSLQHFGNSTMCIKKKQQSVHARMGCGLAGEAKPWVRFPTPHRLLWKSSCLGWAWFCFCLFAFFFFMCPTEFITLWLLGAELSTQ